MDFADFLIDQQYPKVTPRDWMKDCKFVLVTPTSLAECIDHCINAPNGYYALDLETTGLDNRVFNGRTVDQIVGVCLCPDGVTGYYIPLRHKEGTEHNVPWSLFEVEFQRLMAATIAKKVQAIFHGGIFDQVFLMYWGGEPFGNWDNPNTWHDTEIEVYLENPRRRDKRLKSLTESELGFDQIHLHELFPKDAKGKPPKDMDFSTLDPSRIEVCWYGGGDGIFTYRLHEKFHPLVVTPEDGRSQRSIYMIEKSAVASVRWMHRNRIYRDKEKVLELLQLGQQEWYDSIYALYEAVSKALERDVMPGYYRAFQKNFEPSNPENLLNEQLQRAKNQAKTLGFTDPKQPVVKGGKKWPAIYDVASPKQLGQMFWELGVPGIVFTEKSGQVKTSKDILDAIVEGNAQKFPYMSKVKRFREVHKALTNYLFPMLEWASDIDDTMRINFRGHKVDTGRYATPAKARVQLPGWPQMNIHSTPATYNPDRPECMRRLRECIAARPAKPGRPRRYIVAIDFSGVELRLVTNLSREPKWLTEFFRCSSCSRSFDRGDGTKTPKAPPPRCPNCGSDKIGDLHTLTGLGVYGADATERPEWKHLRQNAKATNFALCYGGGGNAVIRATGCGKQEGWRIKRQFDDTYKTLAQWWKSQWAFARKYLYVQTAFGRKYPVPDINHEDGGFRSKAERNSVNGPIQGSSADVTKIAMALVYKECKKRGWAEDKVLMIITMHDELVFDMCGSVLEEAIEVIKPIMSSNAFLMAKKWPVPLTSDVEIGHTWDVPWDLNSMRAGEVRFNGSKKYKKPEKAEADGLVWDEMSKFPEELAPYFKMHTFEEVEAYLEDPANLPKAKRVVKVVESAPSQATKGLELGYTVVPDLSAVSPDHIDEIIPHDSKELDVYREDLPDTKPKSGAISRLASEAVASQAPAGPPVGLKKGEVYLFKLAGPLQYETVDHLAKVIIRCRGTGTKVLRIELPDGTMLNDLEPWKELFGEEEVLVSVNEFFYTARAHGLT